MATPEALVELLNVPHAFPLQAEPFSVRVQATPPICESLVTVAVKFCAPMSAWTLTFGFAGAVIDTLMD